jgi:nucleoside-diphosphate-sugar epimerase
VRPAIVVGDSRTGETQKFDGPYYMLRAIAQVHRAGRPVPQFGRLEATFNVVPVDYVVSAIAAAAAEPDALDQTLHLVDPDPVTSRELVRLLSQHYAGREPQGRIPPSLVTASLRVPAVRKVFGGTPYESIAYLNHPVRFDTRRALNVLAKHGLAPPHFQDYVGPMVEFFKAHERDEALAPKAAV